MTPINTEDIVAALDAYGISVDVRPTHELFPHKEFNLNHYSVVCANQQEQYRVYHWIQFHSPQFRNFVAWAVLIVAIEPDPNGK